MKITKTELQQIIKEEFEGPSIDEGVWDKIKGAAGMGFSKHEKFDKLWKKIATAMEDGQWAATDEDGPRVVDAAKGPLLAKDIDSDHQYPLAQALAKRKLGMELDQELQKVYAWYFEGEKSYAAIESAAAERERQKERQKAVQAAVEKEKGKRPAWKSKYAGSESGQRAADARYGVRENLKEKDKMKITKTQLRRIIKEELSRALKEQGASDEVRARLGMPSGDRNPWQPTSTRWTGMPARGGGKNVDLQSFEIKGIDHSDYPDFADAFLSYGQYADGTEMTDEELQGWQDENPDSFYDILQDFIH